MGLKTLPTSCKGQYSGKCLHVGCSWQQVDSGGRRRVIINRTIAHNKWLQTMDKRFEKVLEKKRIVLFFIQIIISTYSSFELFLDLKMYLLLSFLPKVTWRGGNYVIFILLLIPKRPKVKQQWKRSIFKKIKWSKNRFSFFKSTFFVIRCIVIIILYITFNVLFLDHLTLTLLYFSFWRQNPKACFIYI